MKRSTSLTCLALAALLGAAPALAQTSATSTESSNATQGAIAREKSGGTYSSSALGVAAKPGESLNSLDPTGTFSNPPSPIANPESGNSGINMDTTLSTPPATVNTLPPMGSYGNPATLPSPVKP